MKNLDWIAGYNYIINILEAFDQIPNLKIEIVLFISKKYYHNSNRIKFIISLFKT